MKSTISLGKMENMKNAHFLLFDMKMGVGGTNLKPI